MNRVDGMAVVDGLLRRHGVVKDDEVWVHGMWTPGKWVRCIGAKLRGRKLVRMTHGSLSPVYLTQQGKWKKRLVKPIERMLFALADRVVCTGPWEVEWARAWGLKRDIDIIDLKPFFAIRTTEATNPPSPGLRRSGGASPLRNGPLHVLYLGRRHPLKGVGYLERAVHDVNAEHGDDSAVELKIVSDHFGDELAADWKWADVLCLPTLSENFGLVVAEALERGKRVITTDGAPAWQAHFEQHPDAGLYLKGYRDGTDETRVKLLAEALKAIP